MSTYACDAFTPSLLTNLLTTVATHPDSQVYRQAELVEPLHYLLHEAYVAVDVPGLDDD